MEGLVGAVAQPLASKVHGYKLFGSDNVCYNKNVKKQMLEHFTPYAVGLPLRTRRPIRTDVKASIALKPKYIVKPGFRRLKGVRHCLWMDNTPNASPPANAINLSTAVMRVESY